MLMFNPAHPGEVLREYMGNAEVGAFAVRLGISRTTLSRILHSRAGISAPVALSLAEELSTSPELWMGMQVQYDLWQAAQARKAPAKTKRPPNKKRATAAINGQAAGRSRQTSLSSRAPAST